jgi:adenosylcobinamide kinase/adenosylcobinamide-phosphate guanylyltransferase
MTANAVATSIARSELILGGQRCGKSRRAELLARQWLDANPAHQALMVATAQPWDDEMRLRIARHQADRAERVPGMRTLEETQRLGEVLLAHSRADTLIVVDCLTLWLTNLRMPAYDTPDAAADVSGQAAKLDAPHDAQHEQACIAALLGAIAQMPGPLVFVGNEIGLGVIPMGSQVRAFVDALGRLNQDVARACSRVTLMAAGLPLSLKDTP